jgi:hypothetical protein
MKTEANGNILTYITNMNQMVRIKNNQNSNHYSLNYNPFII